MSAVNTSNKLRKRAALTDTAMLLMITVIVFIAMYACAVLFIGKGFAKPQSFLNILNENAALIVLSCGMSLVMITGGIDISVGQVTALVCMACAVNLDYKGGTITSSILLALGIGLAFGIVQGFLVAYLNIQPFIVSLAGMFFARGMTTIVSVEPQKVAHEGFLNLMQAKIEIPWLGYVAKKGNLVPARVEIELAPGADRGFFRYDREGEPNGLICPRINAGAYKEKLFALLGLR
mgnify:CR=1 FL=1